MGEKESKLKYSNKLIDDFKKMIKRNIKILLCLIACIMLNSVNVYAMESNDRTVTSYEVLVEEIDNATETATIVLTENIIVDKTIKIDGDKSIIIKANEDDYISISSNISDYLFFVANGSELTLEGIQLVYHNENGAVLNEGTLILRSCEELNQTDYAKNDIENADKQETDVYEPFSNLDIASFVISWSGFALAFLTIAAGILSFMGFKEVKDLQKARNDVKQLQEKYDVEVGKIEALEVRSKEQLEILEKKFEDEAQSIMYATYYYSMGSDAYRRAKYREAIEYLKKSIKYFHKNTDAICLVGRAYSFIGRRDTSYEHYQHALEIDDNCAVAFRSLAAWYRYENPVVSLEYAKKAVDNEPENPEILNYYGQLLRDNSKLPEAMDIFLRSYSIKRLPDTCFFLSILYLAEDSYGRSRIYIQEAIDGYNNEDEFGVSKPVWKELAIWIQILVNTSKNDRFHNALTQLDNVKSEIDTDKTKRVVIGHIEFVLNSIKQKEDYINESKRRID